MAKLSSYEKRKAKQYEIASHLLDVGWEPNHEYLDGKVLNKYDGDLKRIVLGKMGNEYYLSAKIGDKLYTCTVGLTNTEFWRKEPRWLKLGSFTNHSIEFTEDGIIQTQKRGDIFSKTLELSLKKLQIKK